MRHTRFRMTAIALIFSFLMPFAVTFAQKPETNKTQDPIGEPPVMTSKPTPQATPEVKSAGPQKPLSVNEDPAMIGKRNINKGIIGKMSGSTEKEVAIGRSLAAEIDKQVKFIDDPKIIEYINRLGQNIVLHSDAKVPFTIKVIDSDEVNAFALPGGFFYVNKGLILVADNEAELAGVMAHEIAHVAARHAVENQTKESILQVLAQGAGGMLGGIPGIIFQNTAGMGLLASFMVFSRSAEEEADKLGIQYLYAAGYDPTALATMFEKLESKNKKKPGLISKVFATHPAPPDRRAASVALAARFPEREEYVISSSEFQRIKATMTRLSNAAIRSQTGTVGGDTSGEPTGPPTMKRRQPVPDDPSTTPDNQNKQPTQPPKLKRNDVPDPAKQP